MALQVCQIMKTLTQQPDRLPLIPVIYPTALYSIAASLFFIAEAIVNRNASPDELFPVLQVTWMTMVCINWVWLLTNQRTKVTCMQLILLYGLAVLSVLPGLALIPGRDAIGLVLVGLLLLLPLAVLVRQQFMWNRKLPISQELNS